LLLRHLIIIANVVSLSAYRCTVLVFHKESSVMKVATARTAPTITKTVKMSVERSSKPNSETHVLFNTRSLPKKM